MKVTLDLPEPLALDLTRRKRQSAAIVSAGLREVCAGSGRAGFNGLAAVLEKLASLPSAKEVLALRASKALQDRIEELLEKNRNEGLNRSEQEEWERYELVEHLVRIAKVRALAQLKHAPRA